MSSIEMMIGAAMVKTRMENLIRLTLLAGVLGLLCWTLAGCTPKRVVKNEIMTGNETPSRPTSSPSKDPKTDGLPKKGGTSSPVAKGFGSRAVDLARQQLGKMYQWGGQGPDRFDCSGLVYYVYGHLGVPMPRVSSQQATVGMEVPRKQLQPGDMLYFTTSGSQINHVGIYLGSSKFIHAPRKGMPVRTDSLNNGWWKQKYRGARRIKS